MPTHEPTAVHEQVQALVDRWWDRAQQSRAVREEALRELESILGQLKLVEKPADRVDDLLEGPSPRSVSELFGELRQRQAGRAN